MSEAARLLRKAEEDMGRGRLDLAAERYEKVLRANRADVEALLGMARVSLATDSYREARKFAQEVLSHDPKQPDAMVFGALALEAQDQIEEALREIAAAVEAHPEHFLTVFHAGRLSAAIGEFEQAMGFLNKAAEMQGGNYDVQNLRGLVMMELGFIGEAMDVFRDQMKLEPRRVEAYISMIDALTLADEVELAERVLEQARKNLGNDPIFMQKLAGISLYKGDEEGALKQAKWVVEHSPNSLQAWLNYGMLSLLNEDIEGAEQALLQARDLDPENWEPHFQLGMLYDGAGVEDKAIESYSRSAELAPEHYEPHNNLGLLLLAGDDESQYPKAEQLFLQSIEASGASILGPFFNLALAYAKQGKNAEALEICTQLLKEDLPDETREQVEDLRAELTS